MIQQAKESYSVDDFLEELPSQERFAETLLNRIKQYYPLSKGARILEVGSAAGTLLIALKRLGYDVVGVDPWEPARENSRLLSQKLGEDVEVVAGRAEELPFEDGIFDLVIANSVLEHVTDLEASLSEAARVLKPGGGFWFYTTSALCPRQGEIRGYPFFGWYPDRLKKRIMKHALENRPELIGHTTAPAYHWLTPGKAKRLLKRHGFSQIFNRWQLKLPSEGGSGYRFALRLIKSLPPLRFLADVIVPESAYLVIK